MDGISSSELRAMVRDVLREVIPSYASGSAQAVRIETDAELQAFIARLAAPGAIEAVRAGKLKFVLAATSYQPGGTTAEKVTTAISLKGVVSERRLQGVAPRSTVRLAADAVLTPLARDVGRRLGLKFERIGA